MVVSQRMQMVLAKLRAHFAGLGEVQWPVFEGEERNTFARVQALRLDAVDECLAVADECEEELGIVVGVRF